MSIFPAVSVNLSRPSVARPTITRPSVMSAFHSLPTAERMSVMPSVLVPPSKPLFKIPKPAMTTDPRQLDNSAMAKKIYRFVQSQPELPFTITEKKIRDDAISNDFIKLLTHIFPRGGPNFVRGKIHVQVRPPPPPLLPLYVPA